MTWYCHKILENLALCCALCCGSNLVLVQFLFIRIFTNTQRSQKENKYIKSATPQIFLYFLVSFSILITFGNSPPAFVMYDTKSVHGHIIIIGACGRQLYRPDEPTDTESFKVCHRRGLLHGWFHHLQLTCS